jgi:hypothetical protein
VDRSFLFVGRNRIGKSVGAGVGVVAVVGAGIG